MSRISKLGSSGVSLYAQTVIGFLRFVGVVNAAIWFGSAVFFTFVGGPAIFSAEMTRLLGTEAFPYYSGAIAQVFLERYFILHHVCGTIALVHLGAEWLYLGRPVARIRLWVVLGILGLGLLGGFWLQPKLQALHRARHRSPAVTEQQQAARSFRLWHSTAQSANLAMILGILFYLWRVSNPGSPERRWFVGAGKFRS